MQKLLEKIQSLYVTEIAKAIENVAVDHPLYAGFVPYGGWEMSSPEQEALHSRMVYLLDTNSLESNREEYTDPQEFYHQAYGWGEFIGGPSALIESDELNAALVEWYTYLYDQSDDKENSTKLLDAIGSAIASACLILNTRGWNQSNLTPDFIVFTDCVADYWNDIGIRECVTEKWFEDKKNLGMLF